jgi:stress response protein SCP2
MAELQSGANAPLPARRLTATVSCAVPVDVSALIVGTDLRVRSDADLVFYNAPEGFGVRWSDHGGQRIDLDLDAVPADAQAVLIAVSLDGPGSFGAVSPPQLQLTAENGHALAYFTVLGLGPEKAILGLEIYRRADAWKVRALGQGYAGGFAELLTSHGVDVEDPRPVPPPRSPGSPVPPVGVPGGSSEVGYVERCWLVWEDASRSLASFRAATEHALNIRNDEVAGRVPRGRYQELMSAATDRLHTDAAQLAGELATFEMQVPPEVAPFAGPSWLTWQPRADVADGVLLGGMSVDELPGLQVPLVLRVPWRRGVWISRGALPGDAAGYAWSLITRFLAAVPPGLVGLEIIDATGLSGAGWLHSYDPSTVHNLLGGGVATGPAAGERLRRLLDLVDLRGIGGDEDELPAGLNPGPPIRLAVIMDAGSALDGEDAHHLLRLVEDGPLVGVPVLLVETDTQAAESVRSLRVRQSCNNLPSAADTITDSWVGTSWTLTPDVLPDAGDGTRPPSLFSHVLGAHARTIASQA